MEKMSVATAREVVRRRRAEYEKAKDREDQGRILDELAELTGYHRKSLVRLLSGPDAAKAPVPPPGRVSTYAPILPHLRKLWAAGFFACGKRLGAFLPELLDLLVAADELQVTPFEEGLLRSVSSATIDRLLAATRTSAGGAPPGQGHCCARRYPSGPLRIGQSRNQASWRSTWWPTARIARGASTCGRWT